MEALLHSTSKTVELVTESGCTVEARIWEGTTAKGVSVIAFITRVAAHQDDDLSEFNADLADVRPPSFAARSHPDRMIL